MYKRQTINRAAITASCELAEEKGAYSLFPGSDWATGAYFEKRGYTGPAWRSLAERVRRSGMRNAYLLAVAPTSSTSILAGTTAGICLLYTSPLNQYLSSMEVNQMGAFIAL